MKALPPVPPKIVVVGSLNVDQTFRVARIPQKGETLVAHDVETQFGGKGANQALAAARAGAEVWLIGCVGNDEPAKRYRAYLEQRGVHTNGLFTADTSTGCAFITVEEGGDNTILVHPGANGQLSIEHVHAFEFLIREADVMLLQLECPLSVVSDAARRAKDSGVCVIANLSPFDPAAVSALQCADTWIVNETELCLLTGGIRAEDAPDWNQVLKRLGCAQLVITRGADSTLLVDRSGVVSIAPPKVSPVDTVGAGDAFAGAFAVACSEGKTHAACVHFANAAGALATLERGAQASIPWREQIDRVLQRTRPLTDPELNSPENRAPQQD